MKPTGNKVPMPIRLAFIALLTAVLGIAALYVCDPLSIEHSILGTLQIYLLPVLLVSSYLLRKRDRKLADCGFVAVFLGVFLGFIS